MSRNSLSITGSKMSLAGTQEHSSGPKPSQSTKYCSAPAWRRESRMAGLGDLGDRMRQLGRQKQPPCRRVVCTASLTALSRVTDSQSSKDSVPPQEASSVLDLGVQCTVIHDPETVLQPAQPSSNRMKFQAKLRNRLGAQTTSHSRMIKELCERILEFPCCVQEGAFFCPQSCGPITCPPSQQQNACEWNRQQSALDVRQYIACTA